VESVRLNKQSTRAQRVTLISEANATACTPNSELRQLRLFSAVPSPVTRNIEVWTGFNRTLAAQLTGGFFQLVMGVARSEMKSRRAMSEAIRVLTMTKQGQVHSLQYIGGVRENPDNQICPQFLRRQEETKKDMR